MKTNTQPPGKRPEKNKLPGKPAGKETPREAKEANGSEAGEDRDKDKPSEEEVISNWRDPRTNQDEQDKITNAGSDDIPIANK